MGLNILAVLAAGYATQKRIPEALKAVDAYWEYAKATVDQISLHGDAFFDKIDGALADLEIETSPLRNPKIILHSVIESIVSGQGFDVLKDEPAFQRIREEAVAMKNQL